jgi:hypothetical protein
MCNFSQIRTDPLADKSCIDDGWGGFPPNMRLNVDQVPLPMVIDQETTFERVGTKKVWINQHNEALAKRQCTLQLCIAAEGSQPRPAIIFRGQGVRVTLNHC